MTKLLLLVFVLLISCEDTQSPLEPNLGEEFEIEFGQTAAIAGEDILITFKDLLEDSRCPEGVQCIWAGNAEILLDINEESLNLNTYLEPKKAVTSGYQIELISVDPYPIYQVDISKEDYSARLLITKN